MYMMSCDVYETRNDGVECVCYSAMPLHVECAGVCDEDLAHGVIAMCLPRKVHNFGLAVNMAGFNFACDSIQ